jgi:hypothetical protein
MLQNNGFAVSGLHENNGEGRASGWPLAGPPIPISDTVSEPEVIPKEKTLLQAAAPHSV